MFKIRDITKSAAYGPFDRKDICLKRRRRKAGKVRISMLKQLKGPMDLLRNLQDIIDKCTMQPPPEHGPYCSQCPKPLVVGYRTAVLTTTIDRQGHVVSTEKIELTYRCPGGCASVAERWMLAAHRFACGWAEYIFTCSRCGQNLMAPPDHKKGQPFWCPGCGDLSPRYSFSINMLIGKGALKPYPEHAHAQG